MKSLCIGIGRFGETCLKQIEDALFPPQDYKDITAGKKILSETKLSDSQKVTITKNAWALRYFIKDNRSLELHELLQDSYVEQFQEDIRALLIELYQQYNLPHTRVFCFLDGENLHENTEYLLLQKNLTEAINSTNIYQNEYLEAPNLRKIHVHYIIKTPQLTHVAEENAKTLRFMANLQNMEKRILIKKKTEGSFVGRIWLHSSLGLQEEEIATSSATLAQILAREEIVNDSSCSHYFYPYGTDQVKELITFFYLGSMTIPRGLIHRYAHNRFLLDGMNVLKERIGKRNENKESVKNDIVAKIKEPIDSVKDFVDKQQGFLEDSDEIHVDSSDTSDSLKNKYSQYYRPTEIPESLVQEDQYKEIDQLEGEKVQQVVNVIHNDIFEQFDVMDGLQNIWIVEEALKTALENCNAEHKAVQKQESAIPADAGIEELVRKTNQLPSKKSLFSNALLLGIPMALILAFLLSSEFLPELMSKNLTPPKIATWKPFVIWIGSTIVSIYVAYQIVLFLGKEKRTEVEDALRYRKEMFQAFFRSSQNKDQSRQIAKSILIRQERVRRVAVNTMVDMLGRLGAVRDSILESHKNYEVILQNMGVEVHQKLEDDQIDNIWFKEFKVHKNLISAELLKNWMSALLVRNVKAATLADALISEGWKLKGLTKDIPIGSERSRYNKSYQILQPLRDSKPLDSSFESHVVTEHIGSWLLDLHEKPTKPCEPKNEFLENVFQKQIWDGGEPILLCAQNESGLVNLLESACTDKVGMPTVTKIPSQSDWIYALFLWENISIHSMLRGLHIGGNNG